jgi:ribosomal protein S18 acetylase RimI-like enzyme
MPNDTTALTLVPAPDLSPADWHAAFTAAFADYLIGPFNLSLAQWPGFLARQGVDLALSRAAVVDGVLVAFALVAPRLARGRWRLGTMGALPAARGTGAAPALLDDFIHRARCSGVGMLELEVFAANERALKLYQGRNFEIAHPLRGYERAPGLATSEAPAVQSATLDDAWRWLDAADANIADLPLQMTSQVLQVAAAAAPADAPLQAWRHGEAQLVFSELPAQRAVVINSLVDLDPGQAGAQALALALIAKYPGHTLRVPALQRPDLGGDALQRVGFEPQRLHQWLMRRAL